ncbi:hypothetical protein KFK09_011453 [Dendrobium nobile]|uniref:Uncharacterized protein n=1 Tax=Dendrobium nobile TaxID=94219 RepID=A0A8T3BEL1_DENNO|nr:hypothetical protein KFK09_011453 [Dendrobium nobile]
MALDAEEERERGRRSKVEQQRRSRRIDSQNSTSCSHGCSPIQAFAKMATPLRRSLIGNPNLSLSFA